MCSEHSCTLFSPRSTCRWLVRLDSASSSLRRSSCRLLSSVRLRLDEGGGLETGFETSVLTTSFTSSSPTSAKGKLEQDNKLIVPKQQGVFS